MNLQCNKARMLSCCSLMLKAICQIANPSIHSGLTHPGMRVPDYLSGQLSGLAAGGGLNNFNSLSNNINKLAEMQGLGAQVGLKHDASVTFGVPSPPTGCHLGASIVNASCSVRLVFVAVGFCLSSTQ